MLQNLFELLLKISRNTLQVDNVIFSWYTVFCVMSNCLEQMASEQDHPTALLDIYNSLCTRTDNLQCEMHIFLRDLGYQSPHYCRHLAGIPEAFEQNSGNIIIRNFVFFKEFKLLLKHMENAYMVLSSQY